MKKKSILMLVLLAIISGIAAKHHIIKKSSHKIGHQKKAKPRKAKVNLTNDIKRSLDRMTMGAGLPLYVKTKGMVIPQSMPQIDAPRLVINNLPRPSQAEHQYPKANMADTPGTPPSMTILPPRFVSPESFNMHEKEEDGNSKTKYRRLKQKSPHRHRLQAHQKPQARKLNAFPFINPGPGFIDLGSNGYSPMSFTALRPQLASMAPFIPRNSPPPPLRLQLRDPVQETYKKNIMTESEKQMSISEKDSLLQTLIDEINETKKFATDIANGMTSQFYEIDKRVESVKSARESVKSEVQNLKAMMIEKRKTMAEDREIQNEVAQLATEEGKGLDERQLMDAYDYRSQRLLQSKGKIL